MSQQHGTMNTGSGRLNKTVPAPRVHSTNAMKKKKSKSFKVTRRMQKGPTNTSPKAVSKATSGRSPAGRMQSHGNINTSIAFTKKPAQKTSGARTPNKKVTNNPTRSLATIKKSLRKSMGY